MILVQAVDLVTMLKGLLPRMTQEQERAATALLMDYDYAHTEPHVSRYARTAADFNVGDLRRALPWRDDGKTLYDQTQLYRAEQAKAAERAIAEQQQIDAEYHSIVLGLSQEAVDKLCVDAATANLNEPMFRGRVLKRGPENLRLLRLLVVNFVANCSQETSS